jgi:sRNA-binding protein
VTSESEAAGAAEHTGTAGPKAEGSEGLINTKSKPDLATLLRTVAELLPVFAMERWEPHKPLAIGIDKALFATGILKPWEVRLVLRAYTRRRMYQAALVAGGPRYDLDGTPCGKISAEDQACAAASLAAMDAKAAAAAVKIRAEQKAGWLAERAKARPQPHDKAPPQKASAVAPQPVTPADQPRPLGLADLRRAFQERKAAQAAVQGGA